MEIKNLINNQIQTYLNFVTFVLIFVFFKNNGIQNLIQYHKLKFFCLSNVITLFYVKTVCHKSTLHADGCLGILNILGLDDSLPVHIRIRNFTITSCFSVLDRSVILLYYRTYICTYAHVYVCSQLQQYDIHFFRERERFKLELTLK